MHQPILYPSLFIEHRENFSAELERASLAIFFGNDLMPRNGDQFFPFRQQSDFYYLSGIEQPNSILVIFPDAPNSKMRTILLIEKPNNHDTIWEGQRLSKEEARQRSGIENVLWLDQKEALLADLMCSAKNIYANSNESYAGGPIQPRDVRKAEELRRRFPFHDYKRSQPILRKLRMIKSTGEIDLMKKAMNITAEVFSEIISHNWVDRGEYEIEAEITAGFRRRGATGHAYHPIVAAGPSACILHYTNNNKVCLDGDLILLDFGAEYSHYAADLSRTIPVNGSFSPRQKEIYQSVLHVLKRTTEHMVPGITLSELKKEVGHLMSVQLLQLGLLTEEEAAQHDSANPPYRKYFMHGIAHHIGLDVHDLSDRHSTLQSGMILTCEPGIYIKEEGIGIRLENNILVTDDSPVNLMASIPIEIEEIEYRMNSKGSSDAIS